MKTDICLVSCLCNLSMAVVIDTICVARCASTGLAIMAPDISRICAVCELRCLKVSELKRVVETHFGPGANVQASGEVCGGCGGKFVA